MATARGVLLLLTLLPVGIFPYKGKTHLESNTHNSSLLKNLFNESLTKSENLMEI
jgi:hypothetical protein